MLKQVFSRAPFPTPVAALPWSLPAAGGRAKVSQAGTDDDRMLYVEFPSPDHAPEDLPFGFKNEAGRVALDSERRRLFAGLGEKPSVRDYRLAVTSAVREAQRLQSSLLVLKSLPSNVHSMGDLFQEPSVLTENDLVEKTASFAVTAAYRYDRLRSKKDSVEETKRPIKLYIGSDATKAIQDGNIIGRCINEARNLGNLREDEGNPQLYYEWIRKELVPLGVRVRHVLKGDQLRRAGLNLLYNVGKGSRKDSYLVVFEYIGDRRSNEATALVGKGVTFDCGGLNIKPYGSMEKMHLDMMGAATVMTTMKAIAMLRLPVNVVGAVGLAENAIGPDSYYPSTIITSRKGLTVEVLNTDAEGRLVLADTMTFLQRDAKLKNKVHTIIDIATLTGAVLVGLGSRRAGLFSNDLLLSQKIMAGGRSSGDEVWPMPVGEEHLDAVKGGIADLVNVSSGREAGSCTAAAFLSNFVEDGMKWAHLDIAGPAMGGDKPKGFQPAGAPGFGVQMLMDYFRQNLLDGAAGGGRNNTDSAAVISESDEDSAATEGETTRREMGEEETRAVTAEEPVKKGRAQKAERRRRVVRIVKRKQRSLKGKDDRTKKAGNKKRGNKAKK